MIVALGCDLHRRLLFLDITIRPMAPVTLLVNLSLFDSCGVYKFFNSSVSVVSILQYMNKDNYGILPKIILDDFELCCRIMQVFSIWFELNKWL